MSSAIFAMSLTLSMQAFGLGHAGRGIYHDPHPPSQILPPGPGDGWGFPNGQPDGYGWVNLGTMLPLGADRTPEYYFPRYLAAPPAQMFPQTYYNCFETRGQRYIPYVGAGGDHPAGGPPISSSHLPESPYTLFPDDAPIVEVPKLNGVVEAQPLSSGSSGLTP
jgi:hypothetical protein